MNSADRRAAVRVLRDILSLLVSSAGAQTTQGAADLRRLAGALSADAPARIDAGDFGSGLRACFDAATLAGASFTAMVGIWQAASDVGSDRGVVQRVAQTCVRFALVQMALITSASTFRSRADVDAAATRLNEVFEPAEEYAANQRNNVMYRALIALHAAVIRDLTQRARPLPRVVSFNFPSPISALVLSNRLYGDGGRAEELIAENRCVHPLFMPGAGRALSN